MFNTLNKNLDVTDIEFFVLFNLHLFIFIATSSPTAEMMDLMAMRCAALGKFGSKCARLLIGGLVLAPVRYKAVEKKELQPAHSEFVALVFGLCILQ